MLRRTGIVGRGIHVGLVGGLVALGALFSSDAHAHAKKAHGGCANGAAGDEGPRIWTSPQVPTPGGSLRILVVSEDARDGTGTPELALIAPDGRREVLKPIRRGGPPWGFDVTVPLNESGTYSVEWSREGKAAACQSVDVFKGGRKVAPARGVRANGGGAAGAIWSSTRAWDRATENFFSAYVESLFDAPLSESLGFRPLAQALRDRTRNFLYDYLGLGEDDPKAKTALIAAPDCADLPYFLRAYFSWKLGLPFAMRDCDRGTETRPPRCGDWISNEQPIAGAPPDRLGAMKKFLRLLANKVHSGSARTALGDDNTDYYPVKLTREALRPGTVFADPYGHVLMLVHWVDQGAESGGILLAVDGQPDNSIGRKRFWEGTFLYANDVVGAGPGFKAFRPVIRDAEGKLSPMKNESLRNDKRFAPFSTEQADLPREAFYARMGKLINPRGLEPAAAYRETLDALVEQLSTRVGSLDNGEVYMRDAKQPVVPMPDGPKIFETVGPWEDYATPSRDMRLQIAMHVLETLPERIVSHPELFRLAAGRKPEAARVEIEALHAKATKERSIEYKRSDGVTQKLTVAEILSRKLGLEMAYNPNDCVEVRWGAPAGSTELASCKRHAPDEQRARMEQQRAWFHEMKRPAR